MNLQTAPAPVTLNLSPKGLLGRPLNDIEQKYAPSEIFVRFGKNKGIPIPGPRTAIVGSRKASSKGLETASDLALFLATKKVVVVSGLAEGVDTAAHLGAINAGGSTVAVLGTSLDNKLSR